MKSVIIAFVSNRGVAQLVAHTSGGRDAAGSSPVTPTKKTSHTLVWLVFYFRIQDAESLVR